METGAEESERPDSNRRQSRWQREALPTELLSHTALKKREKYSQHPSTLQGENRRPVLTSSATNRSKY